ncbi:streptogrisin B precursor [Actinomadura spongiicola]|uniref:Streptogrisin B n=1 Tax=Actinomadura spongiicola TaxID=2303421 RepID=A0A372G820_9ACTN|nr:S1 family peptidase [Actinomadura spongiicola]RFS81528.1 streptogrisin B precursor [Actinomadura spongiicola]
MTAIPIAVPNTEGGQPIFASGGRRCTIGFNVRKDDSYYFLTSGGCAEPGLKLFLDPGLNIELGTVVSVSNTIGLARYVNPQVERPGSIRGADGSHDITAARSPKVGENLCRLSPLTGVQCGTVTAVNVSVNHPEGTITGLTRTSICAVPGDRQGAPFFTGTIALGLGATGSGNCSSGGTSYFQPVDKALSAFGVDVY